jgi:hypothetical protein
VRQPSSPAPAAAAESAGSAAALIGQQRITGVVALRRLPDVPDDDAGHDFHAGLQFTAQHLGLRAVGDAQVDRVVPDPIVSIWIDELIPDDDGDEAG